MIVLRPNSEITKMKKLFLFSDKKRLQILKELESKERKFVELKKSLILESNLLAYHLKILIKEGLVDKRDLYYFLGEKAKNLMPYLRNFNEISSPLPCVAVIVMDDGKILMRKKEKEPEKGKGIFIGGRIAWGEDVFEAAKRHVKGKVGIDIKNLKILCINNYLSKNKEIKSHYIVFFIKAKPVGSPKNSEWKNPKKIKDKMFPDNKFILKNMLENRKTRFINSVYDEEKKSFNVVNLF